MDEHRKHRRKQILAAVAFQHPAGHRVDAICRDLSLGGAFVQTSGALAYGTQIEIELVLPDLPEPARITCTVRWSTPEGMGLQFGPMGARDTFALTEVLRDRD